MWGRHKTVKKCLDLSPEVDRLVVCSTNEDKKFLEGEDIKHIREFENQPLSNKWNYGVQCLRDIDFDYCIMMGSDDYFDQRFLDFIELSQGYDLIAFTDLYFKDIQGTPFYWGGYLTNRVGEPAGAGKTYSKEFLERINYNLFPVVSDKGLDGQSWVVANHAKARMLITSLKANNLWLCDIKDGEGITPLSSIRGLKRC